MLLQRSFEESFGFYGSCFSELAHCQEAEISAHQDAPTCESVNREANMHLPDEFVLSMKSDLHGTHLTFYLAQQGQTAQILK